MASFIPPARAPLAVLLLLSGAAATSAAAPDAPTRSAQAPGRPAADPSGTYSFAAVSTDGGRVLMNPAAPAPRVAGVQPPAPAEWPLPDVDALLLALAGFAAAAFVAHRRRD